MLGTRRETKVSKSFAASVSGITAALDSLAGAYTRPFFSST